MDHKLLKKMKKRKDLDRLIGNGRKHIRKKSGHVLLRTDSQSSHSSDDIEQSSPEAAVKYKRSCCSSFLLYASVCLSICTLILCCVLFGLIFVLRSHVTQLHSDVQKKPLNAARERTNEMQDIYSRLQTLQVYTHHLNLNMTKQLRFINKMAEKFSALQKKFHDFGNYKTLLGSLSNVPSELRSIKDTSSKLGISVKDLQRELKESNQKISALTHSTDAPKMKDTKSGDDRRNSSLLVEHRLREMSRNLDILQLNVTNLSNGLLHRKEKLKTEVKPPLNHSSGLEEKAEIMNLNRRIKQVEKNLEKLNIRFEHYKNHTDKIGSTQIVKSKQSLKSMPPKEKLISSNAGGQMHSPTASSKISNAAVESLNASLNKMLKRLPDVKMTLGYGASSNASFSREPLGHGVILTRNEYFKLRNFWAKASDSFTLSIQSKQRVDVLERKFKKLKKQVIAGIKNIRVLEAVGLKPTERPVNKNQPEMDINVPIPVFTTPRDPNAPTPDPHLRLPWVKTIRDAEINFLRWNRNGDGVLSGDELDPAALRGFMGPYTPSLDQMMHFDVNKDHTLSKKEILCLFGFIPWPCTGKPITINPTTPTVSHGLRKISLAKATSAVPTQAPTEAPSEAPSEAPTKAPSEGAFNGAKSQKISSTSTPPTTYSAVGENVISKAHSRVTESINKSSKKLTSTATPYVSPKSHIQTTSQKNQN